MIKRWFIFKINDTDGAFYRYSSPPGNYIFVQPAMVLTPVNNADYENEAFAVVALKKLGPGAYIIQQVWVKVIPRIDTPPVCTAEVTGASVIYPGATVFTIQWANPVDYAGTTLMYRAVGDAIWRVPNAIGNAVGNYTDDHTFSFTSGLTVGVDYEVRIQNFCSSTSSASAGVVVHDVAT